MFKSVCLNCIILILNQLNIRFWGTKSKLRFTGVKTFHWTISLMSFFNLNGTEAPLSLSGFVFYPVSHMKLIQDFSHINVAICVTYINIVDTLQKTDCCSKFFSYLQWNDNKSERLNQKSWVRRHMFLFYTSLFRMSGSFIALHSCSFLYQNLAAEVKAENIEL